jgi:hypothetical protein
VKSRTAPADLRKSNGVTKSPALPIEAHPPIKVALLSARISLLASMYSLACSGYGSSAWKSASKSMQPMKTKRLSKAMTDWRVVSEMGMKG